jgi:L-amino acid N-acyltransferase YncA
MNDTTHIFVRPSSAEDLHAITAIYQHAVETGRGSFETMPPDVQEMTRRRNAILQESLPYIIAEADGKILGYAYAGPYRPRRAYRFTVENSVYVDKDSHGLGVGKLLLRQIISDCRNAGKKQMIAVIGDAQNLASIGLHEAMGFEHVGVLEKVGFKFDQWIDVVLMQKSLEE